MRTAVGGASGSAAVGTIVGRAAGALAVAAVGWAPLIVALVATLVRTLILALVSPWRMVGGATVVMTGAVIGGAVRPSVVIVARRLTRCTELTAPLMVV